MTSQYERRAPAPYRNSERLEKLAKKNFREFNSNTDELGSSSGEKALRTVN